MSLQSALFPWPWRIVESGVTPNFDYTVKAANGEEVVFYTGQDAQAKANVIMELGARKANQERKK